MSRHRTDMARTELKTRYENSHGVVLQLHGRAPMAAVHVVSPPRRMDGLDGLSSLRMIFKVIGNVSGSHQLVRVLHEVITVSILGCRLGESSAE